MEDYEPEQNLFGELVEMVIRFRPIYIGLPIFKGLRQMTYKKAIEYFVENKPPIPFDAGVMIIERDHMSENAYFTQIFLDKNNDPISDPVSGRPYGRRCLIRSMDDELLSVFGNKPMVLVK
jgi:hypothetical protein